MEPIADLSALKPIVDGLVKRGLMLELTPAGRGQIVTHNLYEESELAEVRARGAGHEPQVGSSGGLPTRPSVASLGSEDLAARLSSEITELRDEVARLRERLEELESKLASGSI